MKTLKLVRNILFIFVCILVFSFFVLINLPVVYDDQCDFTITKGENLKNIAFRLKDEGYISSPFLFQLYFRLKGNEKHINAGEYQFDSPLTIVNISKVIIEKRLVNDRFLITEGDTLLEIEENLKKKGLIEESSSFQEWQLKDFFDLLGINESQVISFSVFSKIPSTVSLEGFLFPDSYHLPQGLEEKDLLSIFISNFVSKIYHDLGQVIETNLFLEINGQRRSFYDILIMASLLEKEVPKEEEKQIVADILWRRLDTGFPLQVDVTICYAEFQSFKKCVLSRELFETDSPYNTYLYKGLPPTPINNPGIESMRAALNPIANDYWYYLTDRQTGNTIFSETYDEHLDAREKYF
jgi:UPF0755 protein